MGFVRICLPLPVLWFPDGLIADRFVVVPAICCLAHECRVDKSVHGKTPPPGHVPRSDLGQCRLIVIMSLDFKASSRRRPN